MYLFGVIDCNNFFASCERIFNPSLKNRPIVVLSNNDGCIISRSNEAKAIGIKMGEPYFKAKELITRHNVHVSSTNFSLYGNISNRIMQIIDDYCPNSEIYSIDEAFFKVKLSSKDEYRSFCLNLSDRIKKWTGIQVSIGMGRTKTLAKLATEFAKKKPNYLHILYLEEDEKYILNNTSISDVWGIGRKWSLKLRSEGIFTPYDFILKPDSWIRKTMTIIGLKTANELKGVPCLEIDELESERKSIIVSRSFGKEIRDKEELKSCICYFLSKGAEKLRKRNLQAKTIGVYIRSNPFKNSSNYYSNSFYYDMPFYSSNTIEIQSFALQALEKIYSKDYNYKKAGITLLGLKDAKEIEPDLFDSRNLDKSTKLMDALDSINRKHGKNSIFLLRQGIDQKWKPQNAYASPSYTSKWSELLTVKA